MASRLEITEYEMNPEWNRLDIEGRWANWSVTGCNDGDVEIACDHSEGSESLYLTQSELREFIAFLQTKIRQDEQDTTN